MYLSCRLLTLYLALQINKWNCGLWKVCLEQVWNHYQFLVTYRQWMQNPINMGNPLIHIKTKMILPRMHLLWFCLLLRSVILPWLFSKVFFLCIALVVSISRIKAGRNEQLYTLLWMNISNNNVLSRRNQVQEYTLCDCIYVKLARPTSLLY